MVMVVPVGRGRNEDVMEIATAVVVVSVVKVMEGVAMVQVVIVVTQW